MSYKELENHIARHKELESQSRDAGIMAAGMLREKLPDLSPIYSSKALSSMLLDLDPYLGDDCETLLHEWIFEQYWAEHIKKHIPLFQEYHQKLIDMGTTYEDRVVYGDLDVGCWAEVSGQYLIIGSERYCSCADDNIHLFILKPCEHGLTQFHARRCRKETYNLEKILRRLGRGRDRGYCFTYEQFSHKVRDALTNYYEIYWALWTLRGAANCFDDPVSVPGQPNGIE